MQTTATHPTAIPAKGTAQTDTPLTPAQLMGFPMHESADMPALAASANCIAFANWERAYLIADRITAKVLLDPYTNKPYVNVYVRRRVGGARSHSCRSRRP